MLPLILLSLASALVTLGAIVAATGGFTLHLPFLAIHVHNPVRLEIVAAGLALGYLVFGRARLAGDLQRARLVTERWGRAIAIALSLGVVTVGIARGAFVAAGADAYGYVSQAERWIASAVEAPEPAASRVAIDDADWVFSPLGYRPAQRAHHTVPVYPPGLPWMMALAGGLAGSHAIYYVVPLFGGLLVWWTYRLGTLLDSEPVGLAAAALVATSPTFLYQALQPMSDVPAAALWCAAVLAVLRGTAGALVLGGLASGLALAVRPNLFIVAIIVAAWVVILAGEWRRALRSVCFYGIGAAPPVCATLLVNWRLYGSPLASGYGNLGELYAWAHVLPNLRHYFAWLVETQGVQSLAWLAIPLAPGFALAWRRRGFAVTFVLGLWAAYLPYLVFEDWPYVRFLLPAMPLMATLAIIVWRDVLLRWLSPAFAAAIVIGGCAAAVCYQFEFTRVSSVLSVREHQQRYVSAAAAIQEAESTDAVCVALEHAGSLRHYGGCLTARYDRLPAGPLCGSLEIFRAAGLRPFIVLDEWEKAQFRQRFGLPESIDAWPWPRITSPTNVTILDARHASAPCP